MAEGKVKDDVKPGEGDKGKIEDGATFSKDQVDGLISEALKKQEENFEEKIKEIVSTEKDKLYGTLDTERKKAKEAEERLQAIEDEKKRIEEEEKQKELEEMDVKERLNQLENKTKEENEKFKTIMETKDAEYRAELKKRDLKVYKEKAISKAKEQGGIIPELVIGNTEQEIDEAVEYAKQRYAQLIEDARQQTEAELLKNGKLPTPDGKDKKQEKLIPDNVAEKSWQELMTMTPEEVKKYQEEVESSLK